MYEHLLIQDDNHIRFITLNNPKQLNALHGALLIELDQAFAAVEQNTTLRGVLLTGAGDKAFAAGAAINEFTQLNPTTAYDLSTRGQAIFDRIAACPLPVVAVIQGYALGGGCELALAAHLRIAATTAVFGQPEVTLGLIPGYGGTQRLADCVGKARALEWILSARQVPANEALSAGLVSQVVPPEDLQSSAVALLQNITKHDPLATRMALSAIQNRSYAHEATSFALCANSKEAQTKIQAFLNKRKGR